MKIGVILLGHGSRLPEAQSSIHKMVDMVTSTVGDGFLVESAALQFNQPDLPAAIARIVKRGAKQVVVVPLFLYWGQHMQRDVPDTLAAEKLKYPGIEFTMSEYIGADPRILDIIIDKIRRSPFEIHH